MANVERDKPLWLAITGTALSYALLGWFGLKLAIPPGYASPLFPAAGFAVAACIVAPRAAWVGVLAGSAALNLSVAGLGAWPMALGIACGSALQAAFAARLVCRRLGQGWRRMETAHHIVVGLLLAGPLACIVSASAGNLTLLASGSIAPGDFGFSWWSWWLGDTLGVLILLPASLALLDQRQTAWRLRLWVLLLPTLVMLGAVGAIYMRVAAVEKAAVDTRIREHGEALEAVLKGRFIAHAEALSALARLIEVTPDMQFAQFEHFTRITRNDNPDIFAMSFNPYVRRADRAAVEARLRRGNGLSEFGFKERDANGKLIPAAERDDYVVVGYIAPLAGNIAARGYDIGSNPLRRDAIGRSMASGRLAVTATIRLVQDEENHVGALMLQPAYVAPSESGRHGALLGFAVAVVKLDQMLAIAIGDRLDPMLRLRISDVSEDAAVQLYASGPTLAGDAGFRWRRKIDVADRQWLMEIEPTRDYLNASRQWTAWAVGVVGLLITALLQVLILVITGNVAAARRSLREQSGRLATQGAVLRDRTAQLDALFELSPDGFVAIGRDGLVRFANPAFRAMTGIAEADIAGRPLALLDAALRQRTERPQHYPGLEPLFDDASRRKLAVNLARPRQAVLQLVGVQATDGGGRFIYVRDMTHEVEVDRMKSEFLSHAAHELRTPMASIYGFSELLITQEFDAETRKDLLETIHKQTEWLIEIINELLDLSRIESRRGKDFRIEAVDLGVVVDEVLAAMQVDTAKWPLRIEREDGLPDVKADAAKLRQALTNVVGNAVKYSPAGGGIDIALAARDDGRGGWQAGVKVTDRGIGMTPEQAARVCERFYRADSSGSIPGTGLGMAIVKEVVELLGGQLEIESSIGRGTTVSLWLPV